jgi:hypothetical protein
MRNKEFDERAASVCAVPRLISQQATMSGLQQHDTIQTAKLVASIDQVSKGPLSARYWRRLEPG